MFQRSVKSVLLEGTIWSLIGVAILSSTFLFNLPEVRFASRWEGTCSGWTKGFAICYALRQFTTWTAYCWVAAAIYRLHPIMGRVHGARLTVFLIVLIFISCGFMHLLDAYAIFYPTYVWINNIGWIAAGIGLWGGKWIARTLVEGFALVKAKLARAEAAEKALHALEKSGRVGHVGDHS